ncbi:PadR family transcriptional regulator [Ornithinimicrobium faecis]|uniref:PadR family transcriptional regulator n=1 Tax=Ornithinimicrobium faecis TaxID=2934158 RepID=A0ABY4YR55_9MICO|nr:PadR family transcriptional regulator [Ornithinimicrobium sp. HY1793]USQ79240.1 PadR family transcriptional regulator [Ornithinimicrobium sp. HY1793]
MAHVILGLLLIYPQSLYDLIKSFEAGVSLFYSASSGSIKRALDNLLASGSIEVASTEPGARGRKVYRVTDSGRGEFHAWMTGPLSGNLETAALSRLYFLGLLEAPERPPVLERMREATEAQLGQLTRLRDHISTLEIPDELRDVAESQAATLDYGIHSHQASLDWFTRRLGDPS